MPTLHEIETEIAATLRAQLLEPGLVGDLIVADWLTPAQRLGIYRFHYKATLREALALTFPVVARLVGGNFFNGMADAFTTASAPSQPCLAEFGDQFPGFIGSFAPAKSLPYLADVALMEWMLSAAAHALHYEAAFYSDYPIARIWQTNQVDFAGDALVDLAEGGGWIVVEKTGKDVHWRLLDLPADAFDLKEGNSS
ncbi:MAG: DNA-binding domain-containing protein [Pseudomonadota bacterium]|nr:DNA-binding domain-containing protein [Pseudomonadota bacterium]